jgi:hypothetical protein
MALRLTERIAPELCADPELEYGFLLHDIGKIVAAIPYLGRVASEVIASHHERWDGTGYPRGLRGEEIPLAARIFAVADAFDAMTNDRLNGPRRGRRPSTRSIAQSEASDSTDGATPRPWSSMRTAWSP